MRTLTLNGKNRRRAFTLIELMVVILILAILAALIVPKVVGRTGQAKVAAAKSDIKTLSDALEAFHIDCDRYPTEQEGLNALLEAPSDLAGKWKNPYIPKLKPDPWGNEYIYKVSGSVFQIISYGADGVEGGDGDNADISSDD